MVSDSKMNQDIIALRKGMIAELETVNEYTKLLNECTDEGTKALFKSIINEELVHVGEFQYGIDRLCNCQKTNIEKGISEAKLTTGDVKESISLLEL